MDKTTDPKYQQKRLEELGWSREIHPSGDRKNIHKHKKHQKFHLETYNYPKYGYGYNYPIIGYFAGNWFHETPDPDEAHEAVEIHDTESSDTSGM